MFGRHRHARCPIAPETAAWFAGRFAFLAEQFGRETFWNAEAVEPSDQFFPDRFTGDEPGARIVLDRVAARMGLSPGHVALEIYDEGRHRRLTPGMISQSVDKHGTAGLYLGDGEKEMIGVEASCLTNPTQLIAVLAHELAHVRLLGEGRLSREHVDHERVTDLTTVFFGLGIFGANSAMHFSQWHSAGWSGWSAGRVGYFDEADWGYALALWATLRGETPRWVKRLRPGVRAYMKWSTAYLNGNGVGDLRDIQRPGLG